MNLERGFRPLPIVFVIGAFILVVIACATVPITGRSQLSLVPDSDLIPAANQQYAQFMTMAEQKNAVLSASDSPQAASTIALVQRVTDRILDAAGVKDKYNWSVTVVNFSNKNAFVLPNGEIVVFTGILPIAKTEAGLAAIIGHEVGHVVAHHQAERASQQLLVTAGLQVLDLSLALAKSQYQPLIGAAVGLGALYGYQLPYSREHESEADYLGLLYMAKAGYDPAEAIGVWERMEAQSEAGANVWQYLSTHPSPGNRKAQLQSWLPEAKVLYADPKRPLPSGVGELAKLRDHARHMAAPPIAPRPSFLPGYWWRTKTSARATPVTNRYVRDQQCSERPGVLDVCFVLESETQTQILTQDYAILEEHRKDGKTGGKYSPAMKMVDWPLQPGKTWSQDITADLSNGKRVTVKTRGEVIAYESVTVPAGTFMAYKIVFSMNGNRILEYWYAPEVRNLVRSARLAVFGLSFTASEMIEYQKTDEPVIQPEKEG